MNNPLTRAQLLYQQSRYDLAEQETRRVLGEMPHDAGAHALLALCLAQQDKLDDAQAESEQAIVLAPDWAYTHYCRSLVLEHRQRFAEAEKSAREAVQLEPLDADYHARLANTLFCQEKWQATLDAAMEGLAYDPENSGCNHLRTMALTKLGRQTDAIASVDAQLARDPDDAFSRTNKGWALLHERKPREALEHFREALRISPTFPYAKQGIVEALKARNPIYRWMLVYFLWMSRLSPGARWGVVIGGYFAAKLLQGVARSNPNLAIWIVPLLVIYAVFVLMTWFAYPLFNLLLRFNKFGWYALSQDQRVASNWFGACLVVLVAGLIVTMLTDWNVAFMVAIFALVMALPLVTIYQCDKGWPRRMMSLFTSAMAVVGIAAIVCMTLQNEMSTNLITAFLFGFVATPWVANYLASARATR